MNIDGTLVQSSGEAVDKALNIAQTLAQSGSEAVSEAVNIDGTLVQSSGEAVDKALNIAGEAVSEAILSSLSAMTLKTPESLLGKDSVCNQCHFLVDLKKFDWAIKARTRTTPSTKKQRCVAERIKKDKLLHLLHFLAWSGFQRF